MYTQELDGLHKQSLAKMIASLECLRSEVVAEMEQNEKVVKELDQLMKYLKRKEEDMDELVTLLNRQELDLKQKLDEDIKLFEDQNQALVNQNFSRKMENVGKVLLNVCNCFAVQKNRKGVLKEFEEKIISLKLNLSDNNVRLWQ